MEEYNITIIDRIMLIGKKIEGAKKLNDRIIVFAVSRPTRCLYYKFKYTGNTQYHKIEYDLIDEFSRLTATMKDLISGEMGNGR